MKGLLIDLETGDLSVKNEGLATGETTGQVAECVLNANRGEFKEQPLIGADITKLVNGNADGLWCATAKQMLQAVGVPVSRITITDNIITIQ